MERRSANDGHAQYNFIVYCGVIGLVVASAIIPKVAWVGVVVGIAVGYIAVRRPSVVSTHIQQSLVDVFISHSSQDNLFARQLYDSLKERGIAPWAVNIDLGPGHNFAEEGPRAMSRAGAVIVIVSPRSVESRGVREELARAVADQKVIIPVILKTVSQDAMPPELTTWIPCRFDTLSFKAALEQLVVAIQDGRQEGPVHAIKSKYWSNIEQLLEQWHKRAHDREIINFGVANRYRTSHLVLGGTLLALSTTMAIAGKSLTTVKIVADLVAVAIPVLAGLQTFLRFGEQAEKHRTIAAKYGSIKRAIEEMLALPTHKESDQKKAVDGIRRQIDNVEMEEPQIPRKLWERITNQPKDQRS